MFFVNSWNWMFKVVWIFFPRNCIGSRSASYHWRQLSWLITANMSMFYVPPRPVRVRIDSNPHQSIIASFILWAILCPATWPWFYILHSKVNSFWRMLYYTQCICWTVWLFFSSEVKAQLEQVASFLLSSQFEYMANTKILDACAVRFIDITQLARERGKF